MLLDLIEYVRNPFPWYLAPMGYVREVLQTGSRGHQSAAAWAHHMAATRSVIEESINGRQRGDRVVVVGSGNLFDVPVDVLCNSFAQVVLVDIFHPRRVRKAWQGRTNLRFVSADVTGVARAVFDAARRRTVSGLPTGTPPALQTLGIDSADLIISANILSQIGVIPVAYMRAHLPHLGADLLNAFNRGLIEAHARWLAASADRVCLVTDTVRVETFSDGQIVERDILDGVRLPPTDRVWDWDIAPIGHVYADRDVRHRVHGYSDFQWPGAGGSGANGAPAPHPT